MIEKIKYLFYACKAQFLFWHGYRLWLKWQKAHTWNWKAFKASISKQELKQWYLLDLERDFERYEREHQKGLL